jgi:hypoxanthine phosphoribosyltransferase
MSITSEQAQAVYARADLLHRPEAVAQAIERLAAEITRELVDSRLTVLCLMNGGVILTGQLLPRLKLPLQLDYVHATRYREATSGGDLHWERRPGHSLLGRDVLLVDDILDEGYTLQAMTKACMDAGVSSVRSAVLVRKQHGRGADFAADFVGLEVEDRYVFGVGMDYRGYLRNVPGIYALSPEDEEKETGTADRD